MKAYQILLVENFYDKKENECESKWAEKLVCELGASDSTHSGKALDPVFTTKLDGTHTLTFDLPRYYLDTDTGENVLNELADLVANKSKIIYREWKNEEDKQNDDEGTNYTEFHFVVNERIDARKDGEITYSFSCMDSFIEELSKTGYGLTFTGELGQNGLGTIHELAEIVLGKEEDEEGNIHWTSGWEYDASATEKLYEYSTDLEYDQGQERYNTIKVAKPVHKVKWVKPLERYCYLLDKEKTSGLAGNKQIYCYEDSEQITANTVKNIIYNADHDDGSFTDVSGWTSCKVEGSGDNAKAVAGHLIMPYQYKKNDKYMYSMKIEQSSDRTNMNQSFLINDTAAATNETLVANTPYLLSFNFGASTKGRISAFAIFSKNPISNPSLLTDLEKNSDYYTAFSGNFGTKEYSYLQKVIKPTISISTPYFVFSVETDDNVGNAIYLYSIKLIKVTGKAGEGENPPSAEDNYISALPYLLDTYVYNPNSEGLTDPSIGEEQISIKELFNKLCITTEAGAKLSAYTNHSFQYVYFEGEEENIENLRNISAAEIFNEDRLDYEIINVEDIKSVSAPKIKTIYKDKYGRHYQYYTLNTGKEGWKTGSDWGPAFLGDGANDKRRTLKAEKSNRFNLIQELAELFKVWPVFNTKDRKVSFREGHLNQNFSGFHYGVNLESLQRKQDSETLVTKIIVEDVSNDYAENGFVTIRTARDNPWGENYFYNFKHYVDQKLLSHIGDEYDEEGNFIKKDLQVDIDRRALYKKVKGYNSNIFNANEKLATLKVDYSNVISESKSLEYAMSGINERVISLKADLENKNISKPDKDKINVSLDQYEYSYSKYEEQKILVEARKETLEEDIKKLEKEVNNNQQAKVELINAFEQKYLPFIKEGTWTDPSYADNNAYYYDAQKISQTSAVPHTSWSISVFDASVLDEMEEFEMQVGDQTILVDNDFFGVENNPTKNHVFEVLISSISEHLEEPSKNAIEVRNYLTSFDDLFQRIAATTQTVETKEQIFDKAANFTDDHQIDQSILQNTLLGNSLILANASDNSYTLDSNGLSLQSIINPAKKARILAEGMFFSNSTGLNGMPEWKTGITADGINASLLTAGEINTSLIKILSNGQPSFVWNELGISAYEKEDTCNNEKVGNILFLGDSYTRNYDCVKRENGKFVMEENSKRYALKEGKTFNDFLRGWPEVLASKYSLSAERFIDLGIGSSAFVPTGRAENSYKIYRNQLRNFTSRLKILPYDNEEEIGSKPADDKNVAALAYDNGRWNYYYDYNNPTYKKLKTLSTSEWIKNLTHIVIGGGYNERVYQDLDYWRDHSPLTVLEEEIKRTKLLIGLLQYEKKQRYPNSPDLIIELVTIGQKKTDDYNINVGLKEIYTKQEKYWLAKNIDEKYNPGENDLIGKSRELLENAKKGLDYCKFIFKDISTEWGTSGNYVEDNIHPNAQGIEKIAELMKEKEILPVSTEKSYTGNSFTRFDSFGLYSMRNPVNYSFNYTEAAGIFQPWFEGLSREECLRRIQEESLVSLTEKGFSLNVPGTKGDIKLGYKDIENTNEYGLYIKDKDGNLVVQLHNDQETNKISGWNISSDSLLHVKDTEDDDKKRLFYLSNKPGTGDKAGEELAIAIGKVKKELIENKDYSSAPFRVTEDGTLHATGVKIEGNIIANEGRIGPFVVETSSNVTSTYKGIIYIGDSYSIAGDSYNGNNQTGWPDILHGIIQDNLTKEEEKINLQKHKLGIGSTGFSNGPNRINIRSYIPRTSYVGTNGVRLIADSDKNSSNPYWIRAWNEEKQEWGDWTHPNSFTNDFLAKQNTNTAFYLPSKKFLFYHNGKRWIVLDVTSNTLPSAILGKKIINIPTGYNSKPYMPIYVTADGKYYVRGKNGSYSIYNDTVSLLNSFSENTSKVYFNTSAGSLFIYDYKNKGWTESYCNYTNFSAENVGLTQTEFEFVMINQIEKAPSKENPLDEETCLWWDIRTFGTGDGEANHEDGFWYQVPGTYKWEWKKDVEALAEVGNTNYQYKAPLENIYYNYKEGAWEKSNTPKDSTYYTLPLNPDHDARFTGDQCIYYNSYNKKYASYAIKDGIGTRVESTSPNDIFNTGAHKDIILGKKYTDFNEDEYNHYYYSPAKAYFYYYDGGWKGVNQDGNEELLNCIYNFKKLYSIKFNEMTAEQRENITHIIVGGGYNDTTARVTSSFIKKGLNNFYKEVRDYCPNAKIIVAAMGHNHETPETSAQDKIANNYLQKTYVAYAEEISDSKKNIDFYNVSQLWDDKKVQSTTSQDDLHPNLNGSQNIAESLWSAMKKIAGKIYLSSIVTDKQDGQVSYMTSGLTLESTSSAAVAFWAGYTGNYNSPVEEYRNGGDWKTRTPFYVTQGGNLYARGANIEGEIHATSGEIGGCKIIENKLYIENATISNASIDKLNAGKLYGNCLNEVGFSDINIVGGHVGGWKINAESIISEDGSLLLNSKDNIIQVKDFDIKGFEKILNSLTMQIENFGTALLPKKYPTLTFEQGDFSIKIKLETTEKNIDDLGGLLLPGLEQNVAASLVADISYKNTTRRVSLASAFF